MPIDPAAVDTLVRAGGWTLFVLTIAIIGAGVLRKWWVPGWIYAQEREKTARLEAALLDLTQAVKTGFDDIAWNDRDRDARRRPGGRGAG